MANRTFSKPVDIGREYTVLPILPIQIEQEMVSHKLDGQ